MHDFIWVSTTKPKFRKNYHYNSKKMLKWIDGQKDRMVSGQFCDRYFPERLFPNRPFPDSSA